METEVTEQEPHSFAECQLAMIPMADVLQQIGGKWTIFIIGELGHGPKRFGELKRRIEGVSQKMLTATLRDLEKDGFVTRTVTPSIPPRVDYELTDMGRELRKPLRAIGQWAMANRSRVAEARQRYAQHAEAARDIAW